VLGVGGQGVFVRIPTRLPFLTPLLAGIPLLFLVLEEAVRLLAESARRLTLNTQGGICSADRSSI